jgi:multidrug efflux pump subunit AcrB
MNYNKKNKAKIETAEMKFLRSVARKDQIRNTKIREELNIKITMEISCATNGRQADSEENSNIQQKKKTKHKTPTVKMEGSAYTSREQNRTCMA